MSLVSVGVLPCAAIASVLALAGCGGGADTSVGPRAPVPVILSISPMAPKPGDAVTITVTATPPDANDGITIVRLALSGLTTFRDSLVASTGGSVTLSDVVTLPLDHGSVTVVASSQTRAGATGSSETRLTLADATPPTFTQVVTVPATAVVQPGDTLSVTLSVADSVSLQYTAVRVTGAVTGVDSVAYTTLTPSVTRTAHFVVPASTVLGGTIQVSVDAGNVGGAVGRFAVSTPFTVRDATPPTLTAPPTDGLYAPGDTVRFALSARDDRALARVGYILGALANVGDSMAVTGRTATATFAVPVASAWIGTVPVTLFAVDSAGNRTEIPRSVRVSTTHSIALAGVRDLAYDASHGRVYASRPSAGQVAVVQVDATGRLTLAAPLTVGGNPQGLDLTPRGDSLVVALGTPSVAFIRLSSGTVSTETVITNPFLNQRTDNVRVAANGRVLVTETFDGSGYGGGVLQYDPATKTVFGTANAAGLIATERVPLAASGDRKRVYGLIDDSCCPEDGFVYDASTATFTQRGTVSRYGPSVATDATGARFLIGQSLYDSNLLLLQSLTAGDASGAVALSPDALFAYFATPAGVTKVRVADNTVVAMYSLNDAPTWLLLTPDGTALFAASASTLYRVDVR